MVCILLAVCLLGRAPHGARGLKSIIAYEKKDGDLSRPAWGAWIEIGKGSKSDKGGGVAPRMGRVD